MTSKEVIEKVGGHNDGRVGNGSGPPQGTMDRYKIFWHMDNLHRTVGHAYAIKFMA